MLQSTGFRIALAGGGVFLLGAVALLFLPIAGIAAMLIGGMGVWIGFLTTMFRWYSGGE